MWKSLSPFFRTFDNRNTFPYLGLLRQFYLTTLEVPGPGLVKVHSNLPFEFLPTGRTEAGVGSWLGLDLDGVLDGGERLPAGD